MAPFRVEPLELPAQVPFLHQPHTRRLFVHPQRQRRQDFRRRHRIQLPATPTFEVPRQVPVLEEGVDVGLVELDPPRGKLDALALHQRQDRQQKRIRRQRTYATVAMHGGEELLPLARRRARRHLRRPGRRLLQSLRPLADERLNLLVVEVRQHALGEPVRFRPHFPIADDPAGHDQLVALLAVEAVELPHPLDDQMPPFPFPHLVETVEQEEHAAAGEPRFEKRPDRQRRFAHEGDRQAHAALLLVIPCDEVDQRLVRLRQGIGVRGERQKDRQPRAEPEGLSPTRRQHQGQIFEERGLSRARIAEKDQTVVGLEQLQHRHRRAEPLAQALQLLTARRAPRHPETALPRLPGGRLPPGLQGDVHLEQRQAERHPIRHTHAAQIEAAVILDQVLQVAPRRPLQVRGGPALAKTLLQEHRRVHGDDHVAVDHPDRQLPAGHAAVRRDLRPTLRRHRRVGRWALPAPPPQPDQQDDARGTPEDQLNQIGQAADLGGTAAGQGEERRPPPRGESPAGHQDGHEHRPQEFVHMEIVVQLSGGRAQGPVKVVRAHGGTGPTGREIGAQG